MKMTYGELLNKHAVLMTIGKMVLPRKASVAIARNIQKLEKEVKLYLKQRSDIAERYAKKGKDGQPINEDDKYVFETPEHEASFLQEAKELNETEIEIDNIMKFKSSELDRCDEVDRYQILSPVQEAAIAWMIDYEE